MESTVVQKAIREVNRLTRVVDDGKICEAMNDWIFAAKNYKGANDTVHEVQLRYAEKTLDNIDHAIYLDEQVGGTERHYRTPFNGDIYKYLHYLSNNDGKVLQVRSTAY